MTKTVSVTIKYRVKADTKEGIEAAKKSLAKSIPADGRRLSVGENAYSIELIDHQVEP